MTNTHLETLKTLEDILRRLKEAPSPDIVLELQKVSGRVTRETWREISSGLVDKSNAFRHYFKDQLERVNTRPDELKIHSALEKLLKDLQEKPHPTIIQSIEDLLETLPPHFWYNMIVNFFAHLSKRFIRYFAKEIDWKLFGEIIEDENVILEYADLVRWDCVCYEKFTWQFILDNFERVNMDRLIFCRKELGENFYRQHASSFTERGWCHIFSTKRSVPFTRKFIDRVHVSDVQEALGNADYDEETFLSQAYRLTPAHWNHLVNYGPVPIGLVDKLIESGPLKGL